MAAAHTLADLKPGDHVAWLCETEADHRAVVTAFLQLGLERGEKVLYATDAHEPGTILGYLQGAGLEVERYHASGQLVITSASSMYGPAKEFSPDVMVKRLQSETGRALAEGYAGLRVGGDMGWAAGEWPGAERLAKYESRADIFFRGARCLALCDYDRRRFDPALLLQVVAVHRTIMVGSTLYENVQQVPPGALLKHGLVGAILEQWLADLVSHRRSADRLAEAAGELRESTATLEHRLAVEGAVAQVSSLLASTEAVNLSSVLAILGQVVGAGRAYVFELRDGGRWADNTYEWCGPGVEPQMQNLQGLDCAAYPWSMATLQRNEEVIISNLDLMPREAAAERRLLEPQSIRAQLAVPMFSGGQLAGFLGFDDTTGPRQWQPEDVRLLRTAAEVLSAYGERRRATAALSLQAEAGRVLSASLDYETTLQSAARLCVPMLGDWCTVDVAGDDGALRQVAWASADPAKGALLEELHVRYPPDPNGPHPACRVLRTGQPEIVGEISEARWAALARDEGHLDLMLRLRFRSGLTVPLVARGRILGALSFASARAHRYGASELDLAEDLARRCALAMDNARLYREAQQAVRSRDEFLSVAAHELKTPITSLRGFAQLALRQMHSGCGTGGQRVRRALEVIDQQSAKLARLVDQLLDVSRIEAGQLRLECEAADLAAVVESAVALARASAGERPLTVRAPSSLPAFVDPLRLEQVLVNLVENACKFSPNGQPVEVELSGSGDLVRLAVRDHGAGIPPEHRPRVFERFYQVRPSGPGGGLGLGLYVSQRIVALHGGRIDIECPAGGGTRFVVTLPAGRDEAS